MIINVEHLDHYGNTNQLKLKLSYFALIKHLAVAGQGFQPSLRKDLKMLAMLYQFKDYLDHNSLRQSRFSKPPKYRYDSTELRQFSNTVGKTIADFIAKRLDNAIVTLSYEGVMKELSIPIRKSRPDLLCIGTGCVFALEAKGFSTKTVSDNAMIKYKRQSQSGPFTVNFSVASVSFNLYRKISVKYYDPFNDDIPYDWEELTLKMTRLYYKSLLEYLNENIFNIEYLSVGNKKYYKLKLSNRDRTLRLYKALMGHYSILLDYRIRDWSERGLSDREMSPYEKDNIFIDSDGIGLMVG